MIDGDEVIDVFAVAEGVLGFDDDVLVNGFVVVGVTAMENGVMVTGGFVVIDGVVVPDNVLVPESAWVIDSLTVFEFELNPMVMFDMLYSSVVFISIVVFWCVLVPNVVSLILVKPE